MTYQQTLDWMFAQLPMYQQRGKSAYTNKLDGILAFTEHLGNPHGKFKSIHVAGTNGKGSSSHMLASILQEAGHKVGLYTSPHLKDFRERIRINGKMMPTQNVVAFIHDHMPFFQENKLSFFEMTVGMAFDHFAKEEVDVAVVEVGLGGRLDSTNIITPEVSLITNIGFDHMDLLGDTLDKIAFEKAGIIKEGIPVVISEYQLETAPVFDHVAHAKNAEIHYAEEQQWATYPTSLLGNYQQKNIKGVLQTISLLPRFHISEEHIRRGLLHVQENTGLLGRWQLLGQAPKVICDTAHNKEGLSMVMNQLQTEPYETLHMVLGFVKDKELSGVFDILPKRARYYFCRPDIARGKKVEEVVLEAKSRGIEGVPYGSVKEALTAARGEAKPTDVIFVGGSNFVVAEVV